jgi:hypothetical protein
MLYLLSILFGIFIGFISKNKVPNYLQTKLTPIYKDFKVKFNVYLMIRKKDSETNSFIQSEMIEIVIKSQDEEEVIELINEMVQSQIKVNIETIEEI